MGRVYATEPGAGELLLPEGARVEPAEEGGPPVYAVVRVAFDADADEGTATVTHLAPDRSGRVTPGERRTHREEFRAEVRLVRPGPPARAANEAPPRPPGQSPPAADPPPAPAPKAAKPKG